ncbi:MAG: pyridoxamine 5'-phosphate oxidase [Salinisphaera sp.]|nr:pyridoxamine 5'-phosphate oxidase [Salinisphaera sp.]
MARLDRRDLEDDKAPADPMALFAAWFEQAGQAGLVEPTAMALATADPLGQPSVRTVLLKGFDAAGFRFYTNYHSRKGRELLTNPRAALLFWWDVLERQVRIEGSVTTLDEAESDAYFAARPRGSQLGACASPQSQVIMSRDALEKAYGRAQEQFRDRSVPRPPNWGGYLLAPQRMEFWQGRSNRLHDRLAYRRDGETWQRQRLAP